MGGGGGETSVCSRDYFRSTRDWGNSYTPLSTREGRGANELDRTDDFSFFRLWVMFLVLFYSFFVSFVSLNFFFLRVTPLSFSFAEMLYERYAYQKRGRSTLCDLRSVTLFSSESLWNHSFTTVLVLPPLLRSYFFFVFSYLYCMVLFNFFFLLFSFLSLSAIFFSSRDSAHGSPAARSKVTSCSALSSTISVQSHTREIARSSHGIKYATERVDVCVYAIVSCLISLVRYKNRDEQPSARPPVEGGAAHANGPQAPVLPAIISIQK